MTATRLAALASPRWSLGALRGCVASRGHRRGAEAAPSPRGRASRGPPAPPLRRRAALRRGAALGRARARDLDETTAARDGRTRWSARSASATRARRPSPSS